METLTEEGSARKVDGTVRLIPIEYLYACELNPRKRFSQAQMDELIASVRMFGIITPITVRELLTPDTQSYEIVAGERRFRAAQAAGLREIPAVIRHIGDHELVEMALIENLQRQDLSPVEEATALAKLEELGMAQKDIADHIGKSPAYVSNSIRITKLPPMFLALIDKGTFSRAHGVAFCGLLDPEYSKDLGQLVSAAESEHLTSTQVEQAVAAIKERAAAARQPALTIDDAEQLPATTYDIITGAPSGPAQAVMTAEGDVVFPTTSPSAETPPGPPMQSQTPGEVETSFHREMNSGAHEEPETPAAPTLPPPALAPTAPATSVSVASRAPARPAPPSPEAVVATVGQCGAATATLLIPMSLVNDLWEAGYDHPQGALEDLRLLADAATRQGITLQVFIHKIIQEN